MDLRKGQRDQFIDVLRTIAILLVLAVHIPSHIISFESMSPLAHQIWLNLARNGSYGVSIFFVVSGYLISRIIDRDCGGLNQVALGDFWKRRVARILPLLLLILCIGCFVVFSGLFSPGEAFFHCFADKNSNVGVSVVLSALTFTFNWLRIVNESNAFGFGLHWDVLWSLAIEEQFYFFYPIILVWLRNTNRQVIFLVSCLFISPAYRLGAAYFNPSSFLLGFTATPAAIDQLAFGCLAYYVISRTDASVIQRYSRLLFLVGILLALWVYMGTSILNEQQRVWAPSVLALGISLAIIGGSLRGDRCRSSFFKWLLLPGRLSYECYLLHAMCLFLIWPVLYGLNQWEAFVIFCLSCILLSSLVERFYSAPVRRWLLVLFRSRIS